MEKEITIKQSLNSKQIANSSTYIFFNSNLKYIFFTIFAILLFNLIIEIINPYNINKTSEFDFSTLLPFVFLILAPILIWNSFKKVANKNLVEKGRFYINVNYTFNSSEFKISGENYSNSYKWEELSKITETKNWILIYTNGYQAIVLDKNQQKAEVINEIKKIFNSLNIKKSLK